MKSKKRASLTLKIHCRTFDASEGGRVHHSVNGPIKKGPAMKTQARYRFLTPIIALLCVFLAGVLSLTFAASAGQLTITSFSIPLVISEHGYESYGLNFGVDPAATTGIDLALGEMEYPPLPPGGGMAMFQTPGGNCILNLRPFTSALQTDTFRVGIIFEASDTSLYPVTFSWPNLSSYFSGGARLRSDLSGSAFDVDMKAQTSYTLSGPPGGTPGFISAYIIVSGPLPGNTPPVVSTYGYGAGGFVAIVNAPGSAMSPDAVSAVAATSAWFEYGPTRLYGSATAPQAVPNGTSVNLSESFDPSSLPMNSRLHFRAVAQTGAGTYYGDDRIVSHGTPAAEDTSGLVRYRTATYRDWADAVDQKGKRKAVKAKPDKLTFEFYVVNDLVNADELDFYISAPVVQESLKVDPPTAGGAFTPKIVEVHWAAPLALGETVFVSGIALKTKLSVPKYFWESHPTPTTKIDGPFKKDAVFTEKDLKLPMPNLHNVGADIYGGLAQTTVNIFVGITGDPKGAHTVSHPSYKDVQKSMVKENKAGNLYHTRAWHCIDVFDKSQNPVTKAQKALPPDKENNLLFADQLTLKLNIAASDSGIFPPGLGELVYSNGTSFDGLSVRMIALYADSFLACPALPPHGESDPAVYLKVIQDIDTAFTGPMDTTEWSGEKVICTGARMLMDVPYLHAVPGAVPRTFVQLPPYLMDRLPERYAIRQNYPNPFNPTTTISFALGGTANVTLTVYNMLGQQVAELLRNELLDAGDQEVAFDASRLASGVYFYSVIARNPEGSALLFSRTMKMLLVK